MVERTRDMSRIEWQRSEAQYVFSELAEAVFTDAPAQVTSAVIADVHRNLKERRKDIVLHSSVWETALVASQVMTDVCYDAMHDIRESLVAHRLQSPLPLYRSRHQAIMKGAGQGDTGVGRFTWEGNVAAVMDEAIDTASLWPATLMRRMHYASNGRMIRSNNDFYRVLTTEAFSSFMHDMALAPNGFWSQYRLVDPDSVLAPNVHQADNDFIVPDETSELGFRLDMTRQLEALRDVNRDARSMIELFEEDLKAGRAIYRSDVIGRLASAGCPVRLQKPVFTGRDGNYYLSQLAAIYQKDPDEIMAPREKTSIQLGIDCYAAVFQRVVAETQNSLM